MNNSKTMQYAESLARLIRVETISEYDNVNPEKFRAFHQVLRKEFPDFFANVEVEDFDGSLLIRWPGKSSENPILFMNHMDVVGAEGKWKYPPFEPTIVDGKLYGRGTLDTKGGLWAMLTAANELCADGFVPEQDIWFESACTEETTGSGADTISLELQKRGITFKMVLDEGGLMIYDPIGGADGTFAMIGVGEKGCADLRFVATSSGGHASTPEKNSPIVRLAKFIVAAEKSSIFKNELSPTTAEMFRRIAPTMKAPLNKLLGNPDKTELILKTLVPSVSATAAAMFRTTLAFTMAQGSDGLNVMPDRAWVTGNMRFSHHQGGQASIEAVRRLAAKYDVQVEIIDPGFESKISDFHGDGFKKVERTVEKLFPNVKPVPYVTNTASDLRYFDRVSKQCIRFAPFLIDENQLESIHGVNENISLEALSPAVDFYKMMMTD